VIAKDAGKAIGGRHDTKAMLEEFVLVGVEEGGTGEHRKVHGAEVVPEARKGRLARLHRAAGFGIRLDDRDGPTFLRKFDCCRKPVMPCPDDHRIIIHRRNTPVAVLCRLCHLCIHLRPDVASEKYFKHKGFSNKDGWTREMQEFHGT